MFNSKVLFLWYQMFIISFYIEDISLKYFQKEFRLLFQMHDLSGG